MKAQVEMRTPEHLAEEEVEVGSSVIIQSPPATRETGSTITCEPEGGGETQKTHIVPPANPFKSIELGRKQQILSTSVILLLFPQVSISCLPRN